MKIKSFETKRNQLTIRGRKYYQDDSNNHHAVIISHGFGSSAIGSIRYAEPLAELGYTVFTYDFCGSGNSQCQSDGDSINNSVKTEEADLKQVIQFVREQPDIDKQKIILMGLSQGGLVSALVANQMPRAIAKLILYYPAFSIPNDARNGHIKDVKFNVNHLPDRLRVDGIYIGKAYIQAAMNLNVYYHIMEFKRPVLICHGTHDHLVDIGYSEKAYSIYKNAKMVPIHNGDHGFHENGYDQAIKETKKFLDVK
ncbi:alpha/beta hydrolase [Philodulcilactobacillus myokoensis]|uniref:Alpha/beta hydrolase n=1 Tax=Philodulcilactobacillus myokoensis TaxID=2929573 RepID=A0A9W6EQU5_9LACO|nr:alpha/beta fold hydrolase [Philodulcilactobacillus myokoensis]GLB46236.1 alpha/beta hydrolase [Philodulcilactobacillus myokoensis]